MGKIAFTLTLALAAGCSLDRTGVGGVDTDAAAQPDAFPSDAFVVDAEPARDADEPDAGRSPLVTGDGSFTRASRATYLDGTGTLVTVEPDVPREQIVESVRLRWIEGSSTNILLDSQAQSGVAWRASAVATVTEDGLVAPDGTLTADRVTFAENGYGPYQHIMVASAGHLSLSLWARSIAPVSEFRARFSYDTGGYGASVRVAGSAADAWARVDGAAAFPRTPNDQVMLDGRPRIPSATDPALAQDVGVWGWQLEAREFATSYIATGLMSGSRAADRWDFADGLAADFATRSGSVLLIPQWSTATRTTDAWVFSIGTGGLRIRSGGFVEAVIDGSVAASVGPIRLTRDDRVAIGYSPGSGELSVQVNGGATTMTRGTPWAWDTGVLRVGAGPAPDGEAFAWVSAPWSQEHGF